MSQTAASSGLLARMFWWLLSVPIFIKVLGIGFLVAAIFGGITLLHTTRTMSRSLYEFLEQRTRSSALGLASTLERYVVTGDVLTIRHKLSKALENLPDVRYVIVRDSSRRVISHTFEKAVPHDLERLAPRQIPRECQVEVFDSAEGQIWEARSPILRGDAGYLQLGVSDRAIIQETTALTHSVLWALTFSAVFGTALGLLLTYLLTHPIRHLVRAAKGISKGDFAERSEVFSLDEIGHLAEAFNRMAGSLETYRGQVEEKEHARLRLLDRVVQAQEDERKSISRELHDQFGQSLAALMLTIQSHGAGSDRKEDIIQRIRTLGDEVHRLAWGMRPSILDDYGLDSALSRYLQEMSKPTGMEIDYQYTCPAELGRLPSRIEVTLYRVTQEALTNIVRHARATRTSVVVLRQRNLVTLLVEDDGQGFDAEHVRSDQCLGLTGMRERAVLLGGTCTVQSRPGHGTTVRVTIPLDREEPCPSAS